MDRRLHMLLAFVGGIAIVAAIIYATGLIKLLIPFSSSIEPKLCRGIWSRAAGLREIRLGTLRILV